MAELQPTKIHLQAVDDVSAVLKNVTDAVPKLSKEFTDAANKVKEFSQKTKSMKDVLSGISSKMKFVGKRMMLGVTTPVVAGAAASVKAFSDFDNSIRGVKTLLDETSFGAKSLEEGFKEMKQGIRGVARDSGESLGVLTKALFDTVSAGIEAGGAVKVVSDAARLAIAGQTDVAIATDGMTSALNGFRIAAGKADLVASKFFTAQKFGKTTIAELSTDLGKVAPLANAMGVSFNEVLAAVSAATVAGVKTNEAFTGMKALLTNIIKPTETAKEAAKALGIQFNSATLKSKGFVGFIQDVIKNAKRIGVEPTLAFEKLFGSVEALNFASAVAGSQLQLFEKIMAELGDETKTLKTFTAAYEEQASSLENRMKRLKNQFLDVAISLGEQLEPSVVSVSEKISGLLNFLEENKSLTEWGKSILVVGAAIGPLLVGLGSLIAIMPGLTSLATALGISLGVAFGWFIALPAAIAALAAVIIRFWDPIKDFFVSFDKWFQGKFNIVERQKNLEKLHTTMEGFRRFQDTGEVVAGPLRQSVETRQRVAPTFGEDKLINQSNAKSEAKVTVDFTNLPSGTKVITESTNIEDFNVNTGLQGAAAPGI